MLEDYYKPFEDFEKSIYDNVFTRVFKESVEKEQLIWHKDKKDRVVKVIYGTGWKLQYDNQLPIELEPGQNYHIKKQEFHRLLKGNSELKLEIKEYE
jgi:quercetin dioxygenase-like cupin family protein